MTVKEVSTREAKDLKVIQIDESAIKDHLGEMVRGTVEETLNAMLDAEAAALCQASRYERSVDRKGYRSGHYDRKLHTKAGEVNLKVPKLKKLRFESAIIDRYRRRESSVEEALIEMYLGGISVRRVEDVTEALWGSRVSPSTISNLNKKVYGRIEEWRNAPIRGQHPYVYLDGIVLKRCWAGEVKNVSVLVAIGVSADGFREILGVAEGCKEDKAGWSSFLKHLKERGLKGVSMFISDKCLGLVESLGEVYPEARWQRCIVHWYRNVFTLVPKGKVRLVAAMLKAIHAQEDQKAAEKKAQEVVAKLGRMKLRKAAELVKSSISETLTYFNYPSEHHIRIRTNNPMERTLREVRRRARVVGAFPDGESALMLAAARLRHVAGTKWGLKRYMKMDGLREIGILPRVAQEADRMPSTLVG